MRSDNYLNNSRSLNRRALAAGLIGAPLLSGCDRTSNGFGPCDTESPIDWIVDIAHPTFCGISQPAGSPRPITLYYPSATQRGPMLQACLQKWPIVLFLHGMPPRDGTPTRPWSSAWTLLPETIARCGYVVAVPTHDPNRINGDPDGTVAAALADIDWLRNSWSGSSSLDKRADTTTIGGHSYGALIAARTAATNEVGAFFSLSGGYGEIGAIRQMLPRVTAPSFFMWGIGDYGNAFDWDILDAQQFWTNELSQNRYAAVYEGGHFDYIDADQTGGADRGPCAHVGGAAADLVALFIASNIVSHTAVDIDLRKPQVTLTPEQQAAAAGHMQGLDAFNGPGCSMSLRWVVNGQDGGRQFGQP